MKTAVSIPDDVFASADALAKRMRLSRSALYAQAVEEFVARHRGDRVTERLDAVYEAQASELDEHMARAQRRTVECDW